MGFPCVTVAGGVGGASEVGTAGLATSILDVVDPDLRASSRRALALRRLSRYSTLVEQCNLC